MTEQTQSAENGNTITVSRVFDATPEALWRAWMNPQQIAQWFAPEPLTIPVAEIKPEPGGIFRIVMRDQEGHDYPSDGRFLEVEEPKRFVYKESMAEMPTEWTESINEARGAEAGTPLADGIVTVTFEQADGKTKMTFSEQFDSPETAHAFAETGMIQGLEEGMDNLEKQLGVTAEDLSC